METPELTKDQIKRKEKSIAFCKQKNIPTIDHLPCIEREEEVQIRSKDEIIKRALALCYIGLKSVGLEQIHLDEYTDKYKISNNFSETEKEYLNSSSPSEQQTINANWRFESLNVLLWSMGYIESLTFPSEVCKVPDIINIIINKSLEDFSNSAEIRSKEEIMNQADLIYRIDWACVDSRENNEEQPPAGLNASVVYERHYALNWLINYLNQDWDDVGTDT